MTKPLISVLMLAYNHEEYIGGALKSVEANVDDRWSIEVIILDDGSSDSTVEAVKNFQRTSPLDITLIETQHQGISAIPKNLNRLIHQSKGEYICFLTSDDEFRSKRFQSQLEVFSSDADCAVVYANGYNFVNREETTRLHSGKDLHVLLSEDVEVMVHYILSNVPSLFVQTALFKASYLRCEQNPYDEEIIADDWVLNIRLFTRLASDRKSLRYIDETVVNRIVHGKNTSLDVDVHFERVIEVINKYCYSNRGLRPRTIADFTLLAIKMKGLKGSIKFMKFIESNPIFIFYFVSRIVGIILRKMRCLRD